MTDQSNRIPEAVRARAEARRSATVEGSATTREDQPPASRPSPPTARSKPANRPTTTASSGPTTGRILAGAGAVAAGIGLVGLMANQPPGNIVIEVNPTPVRVEAPQVIVSMPESSTEAGTVAEPDLQITAPTVAVIEAEPAATPPPPPVSQSEGS